MTFPPANTLKKILDYFRIDANYLFGLTTQEKNGDILSLVTRHLHILEEVGGLVRNNQEQFALDFLYSIYPYLQGYNLESILNQEKVAFYTNLYDLVQYKRTIALDGEEDISH